VLPVLAALEGMHRAGVGFAWAVRKVAGQAESGPELKPTMTVGTDPRRIRDCVFADGARLYVSGGDSGCGEAMLKFGRPEIFNTD
jgi:hypothetical protein